MDGAGGAGLFQGIDKSVCGRRWILRDANPGTTADLAAGLDLPEIVARLLAQRGLDRDAAASFLAPRLRDQLPDPGHLLDMDKAVARLARAVRDGEEIAVFGDYDVDGATSAALLLRFFAAIGARARVYVPDRLREGYGPNAPALLRLRSEGAAVVVTVDCGTLAYQPLAAAAAAGLDVVVVDHHVAAPALPCAAAILNPNRLDETSPHGTLAAVGVAFLFVVALNRELRKAGWYGAARAEPDLLQWLDLVALGTVADVVLLRGLNRAFVAQGIKVARRQSNRGLAALAAVAQIGEPITAYHLGFVLGPRVNAGGRVGEADLGARLLSTEDAALAEALARRLDAYNRERREIEAQTLAAAVAAVESAPQSPSLAFAAGEGWHPGVIGIVAARLKERYGRPACVVALNGGIGKGSGRSLDGLALGPAVVAALEAGLLIDGGGHARAAGFTVAADKLEALRRFLAARLGDGSGEGPLEPSLVIDGALSLAAAQAGLLDHLDRLAPFGEGNPEPRFAFLGVQLAALVPVNGGHLRCRLAEPLGEARLDAIAFRTADTPLGRFLAETRGMAVHVAGHLRRDHWRGGGAVQLVIDDAAPAAGY